MPKLLAHGNCEITNGCLKYIKMYFLTLNINKIDLCYYSGFLCKFQLFLLQIIPDITFFRVLFVFVVLLPFFCFS